jgi:hypothetical protein
VCAAGMPRRADAEHASEVPGEVGLVVETGHRGHVGGGMPGEQEPAREVDAAAGQVAVGRHPEFACEGAHQVSGVRVEQPRRLVERDPLWRPRVQELAQAAGHAGIPVLRRVRHAVVQVLAQALADQRQPALGRQVVTVDEGAVELMNATSEQGVHQSGPVDRGPDQAVRQHLGTEIQHALAEPLRPYGPAVVRDVRRQQCDQ